MNTYMFKITHIYIYINSKNHWNKNLLEVFSKIFGDLKPDIVMLCGSLRRKPKKQSGGLTRSMAIVFEFGGNINRPISYEIIVMVIRFNYYILWTSGRFR